MADSWGITPKNKRLLVPYLEKERAFVCLACASLLFGRIYARSSLYLGFVSGRAASASWAASYHTANDTDAPEGTAAAPLRKLLIGRVWDAAHMRT